MKLTAVLLTIAALHSSARGLSQTVTFSGKQVPLQEIFSVIRAQTGYFVFYEEGILKDSRLVNVDVKSRPLVEFLKDVLKDQSLDYTIRKRTIFIRKGIQPIPPSSETAPSREETIEVDISGHVFNEQNKPLDGTSILIKGTTKGVSSDASGAFSLHHIDAAATLVLSHIGYETMQIPLKGRTNLQNMWIVMHVGRSVMDATVIQAYGTTSRRFNIGSISTVDAATIEKQPVTNVLLALQGQAPGLAVTATSGVPGSQVSLQVRGQNTLLNPLNSYKPYDQPLLIIDGVPFAPQNNNINQLSSMASASSFNGGISQTGGQSPFNGINPSDIESISILKDADATSIYGTQGSNGVILITTKKGKPGKTSLNLTANTGFSSAVRKVKLLGTAQYLQMRNDAFLQDSTTPSTNPFFGYTPDLLIFDQNKYTDWQKIIYGTAANTTNVYANISGGSQSTNFLVSAGYTRAGYNFPGNFADQRFTTHSNLHHVSADSRFTLDFGIDYSYEQNISAGYGGNQQILLPPNTPDLKDASGNLVWSYKGADLTQFQFYAYLKQPLELQAYNLNNTLRLAYKITKGLSFTVNGGYSRNTSSENSQDPSTAQSPLYISRSASFGNNTYQTVNIEPQLDYSLSFGKNMITALVGGTYKKSSQYELQQQGYGYANDNFLRSINGAATLYSNDNSSLYKYNAGFGRIKYIYDQKYILSLTGRRDGSSNFGPGRQFGSFGSAGAGWIFSEERGFKSVLPFISFAKLSGSYGTSGSDGIAPYNYQAYWQAQGQAPSFQGSQPNTPQNLYNPAYSWALKKSLNVALDLSLLHDRIVLDATYYRDREGSQLGGYPLPSQSGFTTVLENLPANVQNKGWEFSITTANIKNSAFSWTTAFNITFNRNRLLSYPNLDASSYALQYMVGKPTSVVMGYRYKDVNPQTGLFEFYDQHGAATSNPSFKLPVNGGDLYPIADREVKYMGGIANTLSYKHFNLYFFFQFSSQNAPNYLSTVYSSHTPAVSAANAPLPVLNYWKGPGDIAPLQRLGSGYFSNVFQTAGNFTESSGVYGDDTYMRLKTVTLSYSLSADAVRRMHIQGLQFYISGQNLLTFTDYKVSDPETFSDYTVFPLQRIITAGLNFNF